MRIKELREEKNLSQIELANAIGTSQRNIGRWEKEENDATYTYLVKLADFFSCTLDYLIGRSDDFGNINVNADLTNEQKKLLSLFNELSSSEQKVFLDLLTLNAEKNKKSGVITG